MQLPAEILETAFCYHKKTQSLVLKRTRSPPHSLCWIRITFVCHRWRTIALKLAELWSEVQPDWTEQCIQTMLDQSRATRLTVLSGEKWTHSKPMSVYATFAKHIHRIAELRLDRDSGDVLQILKTMNAPAPLLYKLHIRREHNEGHVLRYLGHRPFADETPSLRHLSLINFIPDLTSTQFSALKHLKLYTENNTERARPSPQAMLMMLSACPSLQRLCLVHMVAQPPSNYDPTNYARAPVSLNRLQVIQVHDHPTQLSYIFTCLDFPDNTQIDVNAVLFDTNDPTHEYTSILRPMLLKMAATTIPHCWERMRMYSCESENTVIQWNRSSLSDYDCLLTLEVNKHSRMRFDRELVNMLATVIASICTVLPIDHVRHLHLDCTLRACDLVAIFGRVPFFETISLANARFKSFVKATRGAVWCTKNWADAYSTTYNVKTD